MELRKLLIGALNNETCFLCFKTGYKMVHVHDELEIKDKFINKTLNLYDIVKFLFPSNDIILSKSCMHCSDLLIEMYMVLYKRKMIQNILNAAIENITDKLHNISYLENSKSYIINLSSVSNVCDNIFTKEKIQNSDIVSMKHSLEMRSENVINSNTKVEHRFPRNQNDQKSNKNSVFIHPDKASDKCPQCLQTFKNNKSLLSHIKSHIHHRRKTIYQCNNCSYKTLCKTTLEGHTNKQHLKKRPFVCNTCFKGFFSKSNLREHVQSHTNMKELCEVCGDVFRQKKSLVMHLRLHSDTRPYECNICGKRFVTSGRRSDHVKRSHMVKTETCLICNKQFGLKKELIRHVRNVHS